VSFETRDGIEYIRLDHTRAAVAQLGLMMRAAVLLVPGRIAAQLAAEGNPEAICALLVSELQTALDEFAATLEKRGPLQ